MIDWNAIVREHGPLVWQTAYRLLRHEADAADCFQQTFLAALEWNTRSPVRDWPSVLRRLVTVRAIDLLRTRYRWRRQESLPEGLCTTLYQDPVHTAEESELAEKLRVVLTEISTPLATVFSLVCLEGLSYQQVAAIMDVTPNHVAVLLHRSRQALRDKLSEFGEVTEGSKHES